MFRRVMNHLATNDAGVEVRGVSRDLFESREGERVLRVGREGALTDAGAPAQLVYLDKFLRWAPPHETEAISSADMDRIAGNIVQAFEALGLPTFVERSGV